MDSKQKLCPQNVSVYKQNSVMAEQMIHGPGVVNSF